MSPRIDPQRVRFYLNHAWGSVRTESRSFSVVEEPSVIAGMDERANFPLFGFQLPAESYTLAEWVGGAARVYPPPAATAEWRRKGGQFEPIGEGEWRDGGGRRFVEVPVGSSVLLREQDQTLVVTVDEQKDRAGWDKQKAAFWLAFLVIATLAGPLMFFLAGPDSNFIARALEQARVKQGLPAKPVPIEVAPEADQDPNAEKKKGFILKVTTSDE